MKRVKIVKKIVPFIQKIYQTIMSVMFSFWILSHILLPAWRKIFPRIVIPTISKAFILSIITAFIELIISYMVVKAGWMDKDSDKNKNI